MAQAGIIGIYTNASPLRIPANSKKPANRMNDAKTVIASLVGRCCESGDIIQENVKLPDLKRGDILAVLVTGAYNHSMALNYNRLPKPAMVMVKDGESRIAIKRETYGDLMKNEI